MKKQKTQKFKQSKGITLIALVITIIVMLILVAVTITMAVNGGLFEYAGNAAKETNEAIKAEQQLASGRVKIENTWYDSIDDYIAQKPSTNQGEVAEEPETITQTLTLTGEAEVDVKSTITLVAKLNDEEVNASSIEWTSSNTDAATVENGIVTGINSTKGTTTITAKYDDSVIVTKEITVNPKIDNCIECMNGVVYGVKCPECQNIMQGEPSVGDLRWCKDCSKIIYGTTCPGHEVLPPDIWYYLCDCGVYIDQYAHYSVQEDCQACEGGLVVDTGA